MIEIQAGRAKAGSGRHEARAFAHSKVHALPVPVKYRDGESLAELAREATAAAFPPMWTELECGKRGDYDRLVY